MHSRKQHFCFYDRPSLQDNVQNSHYNLQHTFHMVYLHLYMMNKNHARSKMFLHQVLHSNHKYCEMVFHYIQFCSRKRHLHHGSRSNCQDTQNHYHNLQHMFHMVNPCNNHHHLTSKEMQIDQAQHNILHQSQEILNSHLYSKILHLYGYSKSYLQSTQNHYYKNQYIFHKMIESKNQYQNFSTE